MLGHLTQGEYFLAEATLAKWVVAFNGLMFDLLLFDDTQTTPLTYYLHVGAVV